MNERHTILPLQGDWPAHDDTDDADDRPYFEDLPPYRDRDRFDAISQRVCWWLLAVLAAMIVFGAGVQTGMATERARWEAVGR